MKYRGILGYEGHAVLLDDAGERSEKQSAAMAIVREHVDALTETGLAPEIVSVGGTGTFELDAELDFVTELQAGSYVFMDGRYQEVLPGRFKSALTLGTTVLTVRGRYAVSDAGMKSLTNEFGPPWSPDRQVKVARLSEEHAILTGPGIPALSPGDKVTVIPSHGDTTLNLHDVYNVVRDGEVVDQWPILAARRFR